MTRVAKKLKGVTQLPAADFQPLVTLFTEWHAFDARQSPASTRVALAKIAATMHAAAMCIVESTVGGVDITNMTPMKSAWSMVNVLAQESGRSADRPLQSARAVSAILNDWAIFARRGAARVAKTRTASTALRMTADRLCELRAHYKLPVSTTRNGDTVAELVRVIRAAGQKLTLDAAQKALKAAVKRRNKRGSDSGKKNA